MSDAKGLKLVVRNDDDLTVMSSILQDSLIALSETRYQRSAKQFLFVANRFCWEGEENTDHSEAGEPMYERVHCGVCFENVLSVRQKGLEQNRAGQVVSLLSVTYRDGGIELDFSADVSIRLEVEELLCHFQDMDEPWPTAWRPSHNLDEAE